MDKLLKCLKRPLFGLKWKRLKEWRAVLKEEGNRMTVKGWLHMADEALAAILYPTNKNLYKHRLSVCARCKLFDPELKRCRPFTGAPVGCGCYVPYRALGSGPCWLRARDPNKGWL